MLEYLKISEEVKQALSESKPVVALESTIISHGMPYPKNVETALNVENIVRENGAVPATICIIKGKLIVGASADEIEYLGKTGLKVTKASRRDLPILISKGMDGATTVASTMIGAHLAGIKVFAMSIITDLGIPGKIVEVSHEEVQHIANKVQPYMTQIMTELIQNS